VPQPITRPKRKVQFSSLVIRSAPMPMEMANYLGDKGVPVALVVPFDGTQSFSVSANVARVINFTQRDYAYMKPGPGFHGSLNNVDVSSNRDIGHLNIDKSPELHARVVSEVLAIIGGHRLPAPAATKPGSISPLEQGRSQGSLTASPAREPDVGRLAGGGTSSNAQPERSGEFKSLVEPAPARPPAKPISPPPPINPAQIPD
jgi:hypothetical protein